MKTLTLNGTWSYRIGKGAQSERQVPFCALPVGHSECSRYFDADTSYSKIFLKFDGITYKAKVVLNGHTVGEMLPYSEYMFDITHIVKTEDNFLLVELEDISPKFGPAEGWENFGGIIRDVSLIYHNENYITDVFFHSTLTDNYKNAEFVTETSAFSRSGIFNIRLLYQGTTVLSYSQSADEKAKLCRLTDVRLWSPDTPELYRLEVSLTDGEKELDFYSCNVGFREFTCDKHRFLLNGKPLFLRGVCKHELFGDSGHCPSEQQVEQDMQMIKDTGCNFVRLVHYPHGKKVLDIADRLGLMVCEEPGLWWSDVSDPEISAGSLEVLRRTILRDRNHPSIMFWLSFNECKFTEKFLSDSARICRITDPTRMISGANCMDNEMTKNLYDKCGFDFYTAHPYSPGPERGEESIRYLTGKPLLFTEWGGYYVFNNPQLLGEFIDRFYSFYENASDEGALAGALFWCWADVNDFNRGRPMCIEGNLFEGLVDSNRRPHIIHSAFRNALAKIDSPEKTDAFCFNKDGNAPRGTNLMKSSEINTFSEIVDSVNTAERNHPTKMRKRELRHGPKLENNPSGLLNIPAVICDGTAISINCDICADTLTIAGLTSLTKGYPLMGEYGEEAARICLNYADGSCEDIRLLNGVHITTAFMLDKSSRINPVAEQSQRLATFNYDKNFEYYLINSLDIKLTANKKINKITITSANSGYSLLIYGIFA